MKSKQQTPLGYLMGLLNVSLANLGDYIYVGQSSISKWKTGARTLNPTSPHFNGIVEYFLMLSRDHESHEKMAALFSKLYPGQPLETQQDLALCLRSFLSGKVLPSISVQQTLEEEGRLYTAQIGVFGGEKGCASALGQFAGFLPERPPGPISVACRQEVDRLCAFLPALDQGHTLCALVDSPDATSILADAASVFSHPGVESLRFEQGAPFAPHGLTAAAGDDLMLVSNALPGRPPYCALYTDALTIGQAKAAFEAMWKAGRPLFEDIPLTRLGAEAYETAAHASVNTVTDWLMPSLPYLTMSRPLLMEVLRANDVSGRIWTHVLAGHKALEGMRARLLIPAGALAALPRTMPVLSMLCGIEIHLSDAHARRHLLDTAALLRAGDALSILPLQGDIPALWQAVSAFVKRNAYGGYLSFSKNTVRFTRAAPVVAAFMEAMDAQAENTTPQIAQAAYVAGLLERAALG